MRKSKRKKLRVKQVRRFYKNKPLSNSKCNNSKLIKSKREMNKWRLLAAGTLQELLLQVMTRGFILLRETQRRISKFNPFQKDGNRTLIKFIDQLPRLQMTSLLLLWEQAMIREILLTLTQWTPLATRDSLSLLP